MSATPLTIDELFTPAPAGIGVSVPPDGSWMSTQLLIATTVQLPTTSWIEGAPERTIMEIQAVCFSQSDAFISVIAQGGFLKFAASGTVSYVNLKGETIVLPVSPDPSIAAENPTAAPGWLDALGQSMFNEVRLQASYADGELAIVNTTVSSRGPFAVGTYHVANARTQSTYKNTAPLTIPSSIIAANGGVITAIVVGSNTTITTQAAHGLSVGDVVFVNGVAGVTNLNGQFAQVSSVPTATTFVIAISTSGSFVSGGLVYLCTVATFEADVIGLVSNAAPGTITTTVTQLNGINVSNLTAWSAANYESNVDYANRCLLKLASLSDSPPSEAYEFAALNAQRTLASQTPPVALTNGPIASAKAFGNPQTGIVQVVVASQTPASTVLGDPITPGCVALDVTAASNASPIVVTTTSPHGLLTGNVATIAGVLGNAATNGTWTITRVDATRFSLDGSAGSGAYTGGGQVDGGDLGQIDQVIQANVVGDSTTALVVSALSLPITVSAVVVVPKSFVTTYRNAINPALVAFLKSLPIGGNIPPGGFSGTIPYSALEGALDGIGIQVAGGTSYVRQISNLLVNGGTVDVNFPGTQYEAILGSVNVAVVGV
jgi:hypothetical protein